MISDKAIERVGRWVRESKLEIQKVERVIESAREKVSGKKVNVIETEREWEYEDTSGEREMSEKVYSRFDFEVVIEDNFTFVIKKS